jgi:hypothetical protein
MLSLFFLYYLFFIAGLSVFFLIGSSAVYFLRIPVQRFSSYCDLFTRLVLGSVLFVLLTSVYYTKGQTINLEILIAAAFLFYDWRKNKSPEHPEHVPFFSSSVLKIIPAVFIFSLVIYLLNCYLIYTPNGYPLGFSPDNAFYAHLSDFIVSVHKENASVDYIFQSESGATPYHYFEIWTTIGLANLFHLNSLLSLVLLTFSFGGMVIWTGCCSLLSFFKNRISFGDNIICLLFLFITGISFPQLLQYHFFQDVTIFTRNFFNYPKLYPIYIFMIAALLLFLHRRESAGIIVLLGLPAASVSTGAGIWSAVFLFFLIQKFVFAEHKFPVYMIALPFMILFHFSFYHFFGAHNTSHIPGTGKLISDAIQYSSLHTSVNIAGKTILQYMCIYLPFLVIACMFPASLIKRIFKQHRFIVLLLAVFLCALLFWALLFMMVASKQIFTNAGSVMINMFCILLIIAGISSLNKKIKVVTLVVFSLTMLQNLYFTIPLKKGYDGPSTGYLREVYNESSHLSGLGAFMLSKDDYHNRAFSYVSNFSILGNYLSIAESKTFPVSLSTFEFEPTGKNYEQAYQKDLINSASFTEYVHREKENGNFKNVAESQSRFIDEYKINYLIVTRSVMLDSLITKKVKKEIVDEKTGERFLLLNNQ